MTIVFNQLACHHAYGDHGSVSVIQFGADKYDVKPLPLSESSGLSRERQPVYLHAGPDSCLCMDPIEQRTAFQPALPRDALAGYTYFDRQHHNAWVMSDGDKETGTDPLRCGDEGSAVTVVSMAGPHEVLKTLCVGKGHHVTTFVYPSSQHPSMPYLAIVSNLQDGTLHVIDNDPGSDRFLQIIDHINLADAGKEKDGRLGVPNNAFPHGMAYSPVTGKIYSLNNGYGTVNVIDPQTAAIVDSFTMPVSSNILLSPEGNYIIGKGADRKSDAEHVIGRLTLVDAKTLQTISLLDLPDIYPSTYKFNAEGNKLYVTTALTGKGAQKDHLKTDQLLVFDAALPSLSLQNTISVGRAECSRRPLALYAEHGITRNIINPNPSDGTVSIIDSQSHRVDTLQLAEAHSQEVTFSFWPDSFFGT